MLASVVELAPMIGVSAPASTPIPAFASVPDLVRLLAIPLFGWAAWRDIRTRRVPNWIWYLLSAVGLVVLAWELWTHLPQSTLADQRYLVRVALSLGFLIPLSVAFWWIGAFGGADAKAFMTVAILFPTYPTLYLPWTALPLVETLLGVFSMTILTNTVLLGLLFPLALAARNLRAGERSLVSFLARRVHVSALPTNYGKLFEDPEGFTRRGLDLDALRMYLRWRGTTLAAIRADPEHYRDPRSIGETARPGDGRVAGPEVGGDFEAVRIDVEDEVGEGGEIDDGAEVAAGGDVGSGFEGDSDRAAESAVVESETPPYDDPWGAEQFLDSMEGPVYGTTPENLRDGLDVVADAEKVWVSPGMPFLVPLFVGLIAAVTYGDLLFGLLRALGVV